MARVLDNALRCRAGKRRRYTIFEPSGHGDRMGRRCGKVEPHRIGSCSPVRIVHDGRATAAGGGR